jgi:putative transposase
MKQYQLTRSSRSFKKWLVYGSIQELCKIAGVSRSGYYKWVKRQERPSQKQLEDEQLKHEELKGIYEYRRVKV